MVKAGNTIGETEYYSSVSVRKISNGYLVSRYENGGCTEEFHKDRPEVNAGLTQQKGNAASGKALRSAISHIRGKK